MVIGTYLLGVITMAPILFLLVKGSEESRFVVVTTFTTTTTTGTGDAFSGRDPEPRFPDKFNKNPEKTIWIYMTEEDSESKLVQRCVETVEKNKGTFQKVVVKEDTIAEYLHPLWLPRGWDSLQDSVMKKRIAMAALVAVYGGIALETTVVLLKPLDDLWNKIDPSVVPSGVVKQALVFWNIDTAGQHHDFKHGVSSWCFMARRDSGIFRRYLQEIKFRFMGRIHEVQGESDQVRVLQGILDPILFDHMHNKLTSEGYRTCPTSDTVCTWQDRVKKELSADREVVVVEKVLQTHASPDVLAALEGTTLPTPHGVPAVKSLYDWAKGASPPEFVALPPDGGGWLKTQSDVDKAIYDESATLNHDANIFLLLFRLVLKDEKY